MFAGKGLLKSVFRTQLEKAGLFCFFLRVYFYAIRPENWIRVYIPQWGCRENTRVNELKNRLVRSRYFDNFGDGEDPRERGVSSKKLKKGSKDAKRRLSFCRRMKGMKKRLTSAKTARDPDSRINKALRRWNCWWKHFNNFKKVKEMLLKLL